MLYIWHAYFNRYTNGYDCLDVQLNWSLSFKFVSLMVSRYFDKMFSQQLSLFICLIKSETSKRLSTLYHTIQSFNNARKEAFSHEIVHSAKDKYHNMSLS